MGERAERLIGRVEGVPEQPHDSPAEIQELSVVAVSEGTDEATAEDEPGAGVAVAADDATGIEETSTREGSHRHSVDAIRAVAVGPHCPSSTNLPCPPLLLPLLLSSCSRYAPCVLSFLVAATVETEGSAFLSRGP